MSASEEQGPSSRGRWRAAMTASGRWRAPVTGAAAGLVVAAAIVVPSAIASSGGNARPCVAGKAAPAVLARDSATGKVSGEPPNGVSPRFLDAIAQLQQAGTISAAQARALDADIQSGSIDPEKLIADGVVTAAQMQTINERLIAIKMSLATQAHAGDSASQPGSAKGGG
jgi:hypothetical protein